MPLRRHAVSHNDGAALVVAIAVMTVLLAIGLTFFMLSRTQVKTATNVENTVRADLLDNAATTLAVSFLKHDALVHPTYTSLDHAWRTYFNGACFAGKEWAFEGAPNFYEKGIPAIHYTNEYAAGPGPYDNGMRQNIYIPRVELAAQGEWLVPGDYNDSVNPFVVDPAGTASPMRPAGLTPAEQVAQWADVDNDEDGLADSIWLPIAADTLAGAVDYDGDGLPDAPVDESARDVDNDLNGEVDELSETAAFLYYGGNDGLDNDGFNGPDDGAEHRWFLTAPITMYTTYLATAKMYVTLQDVSLPSGVADIDTTPLPWGKPSWVDKIDNDYDLVINKHTEFYTYPGRPDYFDHAKNIYTEYEFDNVLVGLHEIARDYLPTDMNGEQVRIKSTGEPVCELIGRAAILITDEASRVNLNVAGGRTLDVPNVAAIVNDGTSIHDTVEPENNDRFLDRWPAALHEGVSTSEYATELLPTIGPRRTIYLWHLLTGAPNGFSSLPPDGTEREIRIAADYVPDVLLPGYGFVDDNGNALRLATNGIDDDGDGMVDEGVNPDYPALLGYFEGVDEPQELGQIPLRNLIAEKDGADNNGNDITDEMGELSDRVVRTKEEIKRVALHQGEGPATSLHKQLRNFVTLNSAELGKSYQQAATTGIGATTDVTGSESQPIEIKPDLSLASPEHIAEILRRNWGFEPNVFAVDESAPEFQALSEAEKRLVRQSTHILQGLQQDSVTLAKCPFMDTKDNPLQLLAADPYLRALKLGADINDFRDKDYVRSEAVTLRDDEWWADVQRAHYEDLGFNEAQVLANTEHRAIQYTVAGTEAIRITEMMVRPVRRVEAEMRPDVNNAGDQFYWPNKFSSFTDTATGDPIPDFDVDSVTLEPLLNGLSYSPAPLYPVDYPFAAGEDYWPLPGTGSAWNPGPLYPPTPGYNTMGDRTVMSTYRRTIFAYPSGATPGIDPPVEFPNIIEFAFGPGPGLPPGRYYLTINTSMMSPLTGRPFPTVDKAGQMLVATKYVQVGGAGFTFPGGTLVATGTTSIRADVYEYLSSHTIADFYTDAAAVWTDPGDDNTIGTRSMYGAGALEEPTGWVFIQRENNALPGLPAINVLGYGEDFYVPNPAVPTVDYRTFAVTIPPYAAAGQEQTYLHVAICMGLEAPVAAYPSAVPEANTTDSVDDDDDGYLNDDLSSVYGSPEDAEDLGNGVDDDGDGVIDDSPPKLAINFFDFSQEPDHEWVEIENVSGHDVDISGWELNVGAMDNVVGSIVSAEGVKMTVPDGVVISGATGQNRMILGVNVFEASAAGATNALLTSGIGLMGADLRGDPDFAFDYRSVTAPPIPPRNPDDLSTDARGALPTDAVLDAALQGAPFDTDEYADRFVQLQIDGLNEGVGIPLTVGDLAWWVLRGGVFPNYPEHDGIDNDNDNLALENDGIDNDCDGYIDGDDTDQPEGIDEGGHVVDVKLPIPGGFSAFPPYYYSPFFEFFDYYDTSVDPSGPAYVGWKANPEDEDEPFPPPDWKEFIERRFFPGDSVFVTLYQIDTILDPDGSPRTVRRGVVDRVTYTERDVVNRAIDDVVDVSYALSSLNMRNTLFSDSLNSSNYLTFWPDNTMGVDFYRTLERKHSPLYNGDRVGTRNRWEATDGNYDDWSHDPVRANSLYDTTTYPVSPKWNGSPLSVNAAVLMDAERNSTTSGALAEAIASSDQVRTPSEALVSIGDLLQLPSVFVTKVFMLDTLLSGQYGHLESLAGPEIVFTPGFAREGMGSRVLGQTHWPITEWPSGAGMVAGLPAALATQTTLDGDLWRIRNAQASVDRNAILSFGPISHASSHATSQSTFMVAQADFHLLYPASLPSDYSSATNWNELLAWKDTASSAPLGYGPQAWRPVFLYPLGTENTYDYLLPTGGTLSLTGFVNTNFLFPNAPTLPNPWNGDTLRDRWPIDQRAVMYVSRNLDLFDPNARLHAPEDSVPANIDEAHKIWAYEAGAAEALFVWTAEDGVQDGKYNLYLDMGQYLVDVYRESPSLLSADGLALARAAISQRPQDLQVDVEVFTDRNDNGACWVDRNDLQNGCTVDRRPQIGELEMADSNDITKPGDSLGRFDALTADDEGYIAYGAGAGTPALVEIKNNYLAVRIRNWTPNGYGGLVRFAGVVLTPAKQTAGLININTVETRFWDASAKDRLLNPLMGLPGILLNRDRNFNRDLLTSPEFPPIVNWPVLPGVDESGPDTVTGTVTPAERDLDQQMRLQRARLIEVGRPKRADARYYASLSELVDDVGFLYRAPDNSEWPLFPLSTQSDLANRIDEVSWRFARLANLITTRSDVFEILVTVQAGYGIDASGDGRLNWRDNNEFIVTAEKKSRTVYER